MYNIIYIYIYIHLKGVMFRIAMVNYQLLSQEFKCESRQSPIFAQRHLPVPASQAIPEACHCIVWRKLKIIWQTLERFGVHPNTHIIHISTHIPTHIPTAIGRPLGFSGRFKGCKQDRQERFRNLEKWMVHHSKLVKCLPKIMTVWSLKLQDFSSKRNSFSASDFAGACNGRSRATAQLPGGCRFPHHPCCGSRASEMMALTSYGESTGKRLSVCGQFMQKLLLVYH